MCPLLNAVTHHRYRDAVLLSQGSQQHQLCICSLADQALSVIWKDIIFDIPVKKFTCTKMIAFCRDVLLLELMPLGIKVLGLFLEFVSFCEVLLSES